MSQNKQEEGCLLDNNWCKGPVEDYDSDRNKYSVCRRCKLEAKKREVRERRENRVVYCPECDTEILKETIEEAAEIASDHDENMHGGEGVVEVDGMPIPSDEFAEKVETAIEIIASEEGSEK